MKIIYLTWGETPRSYGVFGSQVIQQFVETKKMMPGSKFSFVSAVPIIHSGMVREKFGYLKELNKVRARLLGISFLRIPIYAPQTFVNANKFTFRFIHFISHYHLKIIFYKKKPDVVHCRSYHAAYAALRVREKYKMKYKVVFDARGLWPEEMSIKKKYSNKNKHYLFLKKIEQQLLNNSDVIITVSKTMRDHYKKITLSRIENIYLSAPLSKNKKKTRKKGSPTTLIYVGALSNNTWHKPKDLANLYDAFKSCWNKSKLIIVTTSNHKKIKLEFSRFSDAEIIYKSTKNQADLSELLSMADFSCISYFIPKSKLDLIIANTGYGVKAVEYFGSGLPILSNKYIGEAAYFIKKYNLGISYDPETFKEINKKNLKSLMGDEVFDKAVKVAEANFSYEVNAMKYSTLYQSLKIS